MWYTIRVIKYCTQSCELTQMKHITTWFFTQLTVCHTLALFSLVALALLGRPLESEAGWLTYPPVGTLGVRCRSGATGTVATHCVNGCAPCGGTCATAGHDPHYAAYGWVRCGY